jgi:hypothetical protein
MDDGMAGWQALRARRRGAKLHGADGMAGAPGSFAIQWGQLRIFSLSRFSPGGGKRGGEACCPCPAIKKAGTQDPCVPAFRGLAIRAAKRGSEASPWSVEPRDQWVGAVLLAGGAMVEPLFIGVMAVAPGVGEAGGVGAVVGAVAAAGGVAPAAGVDSSVLLQAPSASTAVSETVHSMVL